MAEKNRVKQQRSHAESGQPAVGKYTVYPDVDGWCGEYKKQVGYQVAGKDNIPVRSQVECFFKKQVYPFKTGPVVAQGKISISSGRPSPGVIVCRQPYLSLAGLINGNTEILVYIETDNKGDECYQYGWAMGLEQLSHFQLDKSELKNSDNDTYRQTVCQYCKNSLVYRFTRGGVMNVKMCICEYYSGPQYSIFGYICILHFKINYGRK